MTTETITEEASIVVQVKIKELINSRTNRTDLGADNGQLKELAANIKQHGVLVPLIVREVDADVDPKMEIVAGHRRLAAAKLAGLTEVPCLIRPMTDQEALMVQSAENLHRKDLSALEEARAFYTLKQTLSVAGADLAKVVDKSEPYVYRALKLLDLPSAAIKALEKGTITAAHAHQLLRVGPKQMDAAVKYATTVGYKGEVPTVGDLKAFISGHSSKDLNAAPFPKDVDFASKIACTQCQYNTGNQDVLFDGAEEGRCTNGACYNAKVTEFYRQLGEKGKDKFSGLKFIGAGRSSGWDGSPTVIKGWTAVDQKDKKIAAALKTTPEKFGFGIIKADGYSHKKPSYVLLTKEADLLPKAKEQPGYQRDPVEEVMWRFHRDYREHHYGEKIHKLNQQIVALEDAATLEAEKEWKKNKKAIIEKYKTVDEIAKQARS